MYKHQKSVPKLSFIFIQEQISSTILISQNIPDSALMHYSYDVHNSE